MKPEYRYDIEQNTDEWYQIKVAKIGASNAAEVLMDTTTKGYQGLKDRLVEEIITGEPTESKTFKGNSFTERGHEFEPIAREDYELRTLTTVDLIGVIQLNDLVLCSPDGLIDDDKHHQIKCPIFNTHKKYLKLVEKHIALSDNDILKKIDSTYYKQCQFELYVSGRKYNIWTSFHPHLKPIDLTIKRDEELIKKIEEKVEILRCEVNEEVKSLKKA